MFNAGSAIIASLSVHLVGNKVADPVPDLSAAPLQLNDITSEVLKNYFTAPFSRLNGFETFFHPSSLEYNVCYNLAGKIFEGEMELHEASKELAGWLYEQSGSHFIKKGEFFVVSFTDVIVDGMNVDAVGLFKSENKEKFIKVGGSGNTLSLEVEEGMYVNKMDKGCLVFNMDKETGYRVMSIDNTNKGAEARYWIHDFLGLRPAADAFHTTETVMDMARLYIQDNLQEEFDVSKVNKADYLNRSADYFKNRETYQEEEFVQEVFRHPEVVDSYNRFKSQYQQNADIELQSEFEISRPAAKKKFAGFRSVLKLDKNFHVYIHGDTSLIENGYDEGRGMKYYRFYYENEA